MSVYAFQKTFAETFPCGNRLTPCISCQQGNGQYQGYCNNGQYQGYCPVQYDNFVANTKAPFFLEKYREIYDTLTNCKNCYNKHIYYTDVDVPINQHTMFVKPYFLNNVNTNDYDLYRIKQQFEYVQF